MADNADVLDAGQIKTLLPHRPPFLFVDRLSDIVPSISATGWRLVSADEPHFRGHFPDYPVMPGVLLVEAMAQTAGALVAHSLNFTQGKRIIYFMTIEKARFRKPVTPGDMLRMPVTFLRRRGPVWRFQGKAFVGEALAAEAEFSAMIHDGADADAGAGAA
jgi:3-hydroxyacyl-[acyl-carrier-protein] dehydratase